MNINIKIQNFNGINVVSSRDIAEGLWKQHKHVLESIDNIIKNSTADISALFIESTYIASNGKSNKEYLLTKDGFILYMFNIQGYQEFKLAYINKFNEMENLLNNQFSFENLSEDDKRIFLRNQTKEHNRSLSKTAHEYANVNNYGRFHNAGYKGLYNGETASKIKSRKNLKKNEDILDFMGSTELAANYFRITQTDERLKQGDIKTENSACKTHNEIGKKVRETMIEISGIAPEELPTPEKSVKLIEKEKKEKLKLENKVKKLK